MLYREYGRTGEKLSIIGFGGMRFPDVENEEASVKLVLSAFEAGVNYFDTAPGYCKDLSEVRVGQAIKEMKRSGRKFYVSTKSWRSDAKELRADLEKSLKRLNVEAIDFYHCWCVMGPKEWEERKAGGAVREMLKAKEEGLVRHVCVSTHMAGDDIGKMLAEGVFEGVLLGYSAVNAPYRGPGIEAARKLGLGVAIMNPLGGGLIPKHPDRLGFIRREGDTSLVHSALRFVLSTPGVTVALVGMDSPEHAREAAAAADSFRPLSSAEMDGVRRQVDREFDQLCTLCRYCDKCPQEIPVPKYMSAYNYMVLDGEKPMKDFLKWHWDLEEAASKVAEVCTQCGTCEKLCTQHLPIIERLKAIAAAHTANK
jgi:predicted aldo/keto reductase-like oxidoreductase